MFRCKDTFLLQLQEDTILLLMIQSWTFMQCKGVKKVQHRIVSFIMPVKVHSIIYISSCKNNSLVPQLQGMDQVFICQYPLNNIEGNCKQGASEYEPSQHLQRMRPGAATRRGWHFGYPSTSFLSMNLGYPAFQCFFLLLMISLFCFGKFI